MDITNLKNIVEKEFKQLFGNSVGYIHLKNDNKFWFILETQKEFNYGHRDYIEKICKDHMKIMTDLQNDFTKIHERDSLAQILEKKYQRALNRNELI